MIRKGCFNYGQIRSKPMTIFSILNVSAADRIIAMIISLRK